MLRCIASSLLDCEIIDSTSALTCFLSADVVISSLAVNKQHNYIVKRTFKGEKKLTIVAVVES